MTKKPPTTTRKPSGKNKTSIRFSSDKNDAKVSSEAPVDTNGMVESMRHQLRVAQRNNENLKKSVRPATVRQDVEGKYDKSKVTFSARAYENGHEGVELKGWRRLSDHELREVAQVDPYISAIVANRCGQAAVIGRPSDSKFDKGTRVMELTPVNLDDFETSAEFERVQESRKKQMKAIIDWLMGCGTKDKDILNEIFRGADPTFKTCTFADFLSAQVRNLLTFGRMGSQIFRNEDNVPVAFRPTPIETIHPVIQGGDAYVGRGDDTMEQSIEDSEEYNQLAEDDRPHAYIQRVDGRNVNFFTEDDLKVAYFQKQALFDLTGYPLSPIEQAIYMVFIHQNTLGYLRNQFVKGMGTKGILSLKSDDASAELSDEDLDSLRREFHNFLNRTDNSAATPVISGPVEVKWIQLAATPRDMEFLQVEEHVIRALCAAFQTSPLEMGYGHLGISGNGGMTQANKQEEIIRGEERGLRMILDVVFDHINEILYDNFPEARELFRITYVGVGEDTRDAVVERHQQEMQTTATMNSLWADSEKNEPIPDGGNVPLSPIFHQNVVRYMKYGIFMDKFFGTENWASKPEYDFIIDPALNQSYQDNKMFTDDMRHEQGILQIETQEAQLEGMQGQNQAMEAQMQMGGAPGQEGAPEGAMPPGAEEGGEEPQEGAPQPQEELAQSLEDAFKERTAPLRKSEHYFMAWNRGHEDKKDDDTEETEEKDSE